MNEEDLDEMNDEKVKQYLRSLSKEDLEAFNLQVAIVRKTKSAIAHGKTVSDYITTLPSKINKEDFTKWNLDPRGSFELKVHSYWLGNPCWPDVKEIRNFSLNFKPSKWYKRKKHILSGCSEGDRAFASPYDSNLLLFFHYDLIENYLKNLIKGDLSSYSRLNIIDWL
jgi:hypothetical protein